MRRRVIAAVTAVVLAIAGAVILLNYVAGADKRAAAGMSTTSVLVVTASIAKGTSVQDLGDRVATTELPRKAVASGAVTTLTQLSGLVATADLQPGEQLLKSRFAKPDTLHADEGVQVPDGMQQVAFLLEPQRVIGGDLAAGARVGIFISFQDPKETQLAIDQVLVTKVQGGLTAVQNDGTKDPNKDANKDAAKQAPGGSIMVTVALSAPDAQKLVFGTEHGSIWLSLEAAHER